MGRVTVPSRRRGAALLLLALPLLLVPATVRGQGCPNSPIFSSTTLGTNSWTLVNATTIGTIGSNWVINPGNDPQVISPTLSCAASSYNYMRIGLNNHGTDTNGRVYFDNGSGYAESRSAGFTDPSNPSRDSWITVRLDNISGWSGTIQHLRVDPVANGSGGADDVHLCYFFWRKDTKAPIFNSVTVTPSGWTNGDIKVDVTANDPYEVNNTGPDVYGSGVVGFNVRLDGGAWVYQPRAYQDDFDGRTTLHLIYYAGTLSTGAHTIEIQAKDLIGHLSGIETRTLYYDGTAPNVPGQPGVSPSGCTTVNSFTFWWGDPGDPGSGVTHYQYLTDDGSGAHDVYSTSIVLAAASVGEHWFQVSAVDAMGWQSDWSARRYFYFDNAPPPPPSNLAASPSGWTNLNSFTMTWNAVNDPGCGISYYEYSINDGPSQTTPSTAVSGALAAVRDSNTFKVRAWDGVGYASGWSSVGFKWNPDYVPAPDILAPADGVAMSLPETFSWDARPGAAAYELQVSNRTDFAGRPWTANTSLASLLVPPEAAPANGNWAWRIRSTRDGAPVIWGPVHTFTRVTAVSPPGTASLAYPGNGTTQAPGDIPFQWSSVPGATSYRLEVSTDPAFPSGTASGAVREGLTGTLEHVTLVTPGLQLYWRVTARNGSGYGLPSSVWSVATGSAPPTLSGALITAPSADLTVDQGASVQASAMIVGRYSGPVTTEWALDDVVFSSTAVTLAGTGIDVGPVAVPTGDIGEHQLVFRAFAADTVSSTVRTVGVTAPGVGPPDHLVVVADQPQLLANTSTTLYCTVRDSDNTILIDDGGRVVTFTPDDNAGTVAPTSAVTAAGLATSTYTAPVNEASLQVSVDTDGFAPGMRARSVAAVRGDRIGLGVARTQLAQEKNIAFAYLDRLAALPRNGVDGAVPGVSPIGRFTWPHVNTDNAARFVSAAQIGDIARLHRLNIFLRYLDRIYFYDPGVDKLGTPESRPIDGVLTMEFCYARAGGSLTGAVYEIASEWNKRADIRPTGVWWLDKALNVLKAILKALADQLVVGFNAAGKFAIQKVCHTTALKNEAEGLWSVGIEATRSALNYVFGDKGSFSLATFISNGILPTTIASYGLQRQFADPVSGQLDYVVSNLKSPGWSGGSDGPSEAVVSAALIEVRTKTDYQHRWFQKANETLNGQVVTALASDAEIVGALGGKYMQAFARILMILVKNAILMGSGWDCMTTASSISHQQLPVVAGYIVASGGEPLAPFRLQQALSLKPVAVPAPTHAPLAMAAVAASAEAVTTNLDAYETAAHALEQDLVTADTTAALVHVPALADQEAALSDAAAASFGPLYATLESARLQVGDHMATVDSLRSLLDAASLSRTRAFAAVADWQQGAPDAALQAAALAQVRGSLDTTRTAFATVVSYLTVTLGEDATPFVSIGAPHVPAWAIQGDTATVRAIATNLGSGTATDVHVTMVAGPDVAFDDSTGFTVGDLAPGESREVTWRVRFLPSIPSTDSTASVTFSVAVDGISSGVGSGHEGTVEVLSSVLVLGVPSGGPARGMRLALGPNPSRSDVRILFEVPGNRAGQVEILDIAGRRVRTLTRWAEGAHPGSYLWDGRGDDGHPVAPGVYLARLRSGRDSRVVRLVRLR